MSNIKSEIGIVLVVAVTAIVFTALVASSVSPVQGRQMEIHLVLQTIHQRCRQVVVVLIMPQVRVQTVLDLRLSELRNDGISLRT